MTDSEHRSELAAAAGANDASGFLAVFGGSFDPPHLGHASVALGALSLGATRVLVCPTFEHPFGKTHGASFEARLRMCELAFDVLPTVEVSAIERHVNDGRTLHLLEALARQRAMPMRLLMGADLWITREKWHRWSDVARLAPPLVFGRAGYASTAAFDVPDISSTAIRAAIAAGHRPVGLASSITQFVKDQRLYGSPV